MRLWIDLGLLAVGAPAGAHAQGKFPPDSCTNLKVLPKDIGPRALVDTACAATCRRCAIGARECQATRC